MDASIDSWIAVLDQVSHYELLGVQPGFGADTLRRAYQGFAATFHPDVHMHRNAEERESVNRIFKRGTEAYRVLSDANLRARYDEQRTGRPSTPPNARNAPLPPPASTRAPGSMSPSAGPKPGVLMSTTGRLEEFVKNPRARPFAQQAEAFAKKAEHAKAKLQLRLAMNIDPGNSALEAYSRELDLLIAQEKNKPYQPR